MVGFSLMGGFQVGNLRLVANLHSLSQFVGGCLVLLELGLEFLVICGFLGRQFCFPFFSNLTACLFYFRSDINTVLLGQRLELDLNL